MKGVALLLLALSFFGIVHATSAFSNVEAVIDNMDITQDDKEYYKQALKDYLSEETKELIIERVEDEAFEYFEKKTGKYLDVGIAGKIFLIGDAIEWFKAYDEWEKNPSWQNEEVLNEKAMGFYSNFLGPGGLLIDGTILIMSSEREKITDRQYVMSLIDKVLREREDKSIATKLFESASGNAQMIFGTKSVHNSDGSWSTKIGDDSEPKWGLLRYLNNEQIEELAAYLQNNPDPSINAYNSPAFLRFMKGGGPAMFQKHSPVYMTITDPNGVIYGIDPETKETMCNNDWICPVLQNASDAQQLVIPSIMNGTYTVRLYGFSDGNYSFEFIGFNHSYNLQGIVKKTGYINKGEVLESVFEIQLYDNNYVITEHAFAAINETFNIPSNPEFMPLKLVSASPAKNSTLFEAKPLVTITFNMPVAAKQFLTDSLGDEVESFISMTNYNKTVQLIPLAPLSSGEYHINLEPYWVNETINFYVNNPYSSGVKYKLSSPVIRSVTKYFRVTNNDSRNAEFSVDFSIFKTTPPHTFSKIISVSKNPDYNLTDSLGNNHYTWEVFLQPGESLEISADFIILSFNADFLSYLDLSEQISTSASGFGADGSCINLTDSSIKNLAFEITTGEDTNLSKALRITEWVRSNIEYDYSINQNEGASDTLAYKTGVCHGYTCLTASLLRNLGVPARYVAGESMGKGVNITLEGLHAWNEVYVEGIGWAPIDTTWTSSLGDFFLKSRNSHAAYMHLEGWPAEGFINWFDAPSNIISSFFTKYSAVDSSSLSPEIRTLYDTVESLDFLDSFKYYYLWNDSVRDWTFLGNHLSSPSNAIILMQEEISKYNNTGVVNSSSSTFLIYSDFISSLDSLTDYYYNYLNNSYTSCSLARSGCANFSSHHDYNNPSVTLGYLLSSTKETLKNAKEALSDNDYDEVKELINASVSNIYYISYDSGTLDYSLPVEANYSEEMSLSEAFFILLLPLIFGVYPFFTFFHCILKKKLKQNKKTIYLLMIFFLNALGATYYWIKER